MAILITMRYCSTGTTCWNQTDMSISSGFFEESLDQERPAETASINSPSGSDVALRDSPSQSGKNHDSSTILKTIDNIAKEAVVEEQRDLGHCHGNNMPYDLSVSESSHPKEVPVHTGQPSTMPGVEGRLEYRPTPIAELKRRQAAGIDVTREHPSYEYDPTCPSTSVGRSLGYHPTPITDLDISDIRQEPTVNKYSEAFQYYKYHGTDMEYDPIMNYRCSALAKQQKRKLLDISEQGSEVLGSSKPDGEQRERGHDHHASDCCQDSSELLEDTAADDLSNNEEIRLRVSDNNEMKLNLSESDLNNNSEINLRGSESDIASETALDLSTTGGKVMASVADRVKGIKQLESKNSTEKTAVVPVGTLDNLNTASNISTGSESSIIKKRKIPKYLTDAKHCKDQLETSDENAAKHDDVSSVDSITITKQKDVTSKVDSNKKKLTRRNPVKEVNTTKQKRLKKRRVLDLLLSGSKLESTNKNSSKPSRCEKVVDEEGFLNCLPQESASLTKVPDIKLSDSYNPKLEKMDWIKTNDEADEELSVKGKGELRYSLRSYSPVSKKGNSNDKGRKIEASPRSQKKLTPKSLKGEGKSSWRFFSYWTPKKEASNNKGRKKVVARKSPRSQEKLSPKSKSPYDLTFRESESDSFYKDCEELSSFYISNRKI